MAVDEAARHRFFNKAVEVFGEEEATILMAHLPPGGWPNLATKQDVLALRQELVGKLGGVEQGLQGEFRGELRALESRLKAYTLRTILAANASMTAVFAGIAVAALGVS